MRLRPLFDKRVSSKLFPDKEAEGEAKRKVEETMSQQPERKNKGAFGYILAIIALLGVLAFGIWKMATSVDKPPPPAPLPSAAISAPPNVPVAGPTDEVEVEVNTEATADPTKAPKAGDSTMGDSSGPGNNTDSTTGTKISPNSNKNDDLAGDDAGVEENGVSDGSEGSQALPDTDTITSPGKNTVNNEDLPQGLKNTATKKVKMSTKTMQANRLFVPAIGTYARVEQHPISKGYLLLNKNPRILTQWDKGAPVVSTTGSTVLGGHISYNGVIGSLYNLYKLKAGNLAYLSDAQGHVSKFKLVSLHNYKKAGLPQDIWRQDLGRKLVLVTCGGKFNASTRHYDDNVVAEFVPAD